MERHTNGLRACIAGCAMRHGKLLRRHANSQSPKSSSRSWCQCFHIPQPAPVLQVHTSSRACQRCRKGLVVRVSHLSAASLAAVPTQTTKIFQLSPVYREHLYAGTISNVQARETLDKLSFSGVRISASAKDLQEMDQGSRDAQLHALSQQFKGQTPTQQTVITCMTTIKKAHDEVHRQILPS